jgi:transposase
MKAYSQDLRNRVIRALERDESPTEIAARFEVSRGWVYHVDQDRRSGRLTSRPMGGHRRSQLCAYEAAIRQWIQEKPDLTLQEILDRLVAEHQVTIKVGALWHQINKWGLSFKKNSTRVRARPSGRPGKAQ